MTEFEIGLSEKVDHFEPKQKGRKRRKGKRSKFSSIFWCSLYVFLVFGLCISGTWTFIKTYYYPIYVSGSSMAPTLHGGTGDGIHDFGFIDTNKSVLKNLQRFDIVTTFFPFSSDDYNLPYKIGDKPKEGASHKIKRIIALPGDTFTIDDNEIYFLENGELTKAQITFDRLLDRTNPVDFKDNNIGDENGFLTLKDNEYYVMGDNWPDSRDSHQPNDSLSGPVYFENIVGVLVAIVGTCNISNDQIINRKYHFPRFYK